MSNPHISKISDLENKTGESLNAVIKEHYDLTDLQASTLRSLMFMREISFSELHEMIQCLKTYKEDLLITLKKMSDSTHVSINVGISKIKSHKKEK